MAGTRSRGQGRRASLVVACCAIALLAALATTGAPSVALAASPIPIARFTCSAPGTTLVCTPCPVSCSTDSAGFALTGSPVTLDGRASSDDRGTPGTPNGSIVSYEWTTGGAILGSGALLGHVFAQGGTYPVQLRVIDDDGGFDTKLRTIRVNAAPVASFVVSPPAGTPRPGDTVSFDAASSRDDGATTPSKQGIVSYAWTIPGRPTITTSATAHVFTQPGAYPVRLAVTDGDGTTSIQDQTVRVDAAPTDDATSPVVPVTPAPAVVAAFRQTVAGGVIRVERSVRFDAGGSLPAGGSITRYRWSFGDGAVRTGIRVRHRFHAARSHRVTLTVTHRDGRTASVSRTLRVHGLAACPRLRRGTALGTIMRLGNRADAYDGGGGADTIYGGGGADCLFGGAGADRIYGQGGADRLVGGPGADLLSGGAGDDVISAYGDGARDEISCGAGYDVVYADLRDRVARDCERVVRSRAPRSHLP